MNSIHSELIQFFKEQNQEYNFLLHRTKKKEDAISILKNGLYFEEHLGKVTDPLSGATELSLIGNRMFFESFGAYVIIIAIKKQVVDVYDKIVERVNKRNMLTIFDKEELSTFEELYRLPPVYIMAYNLGFDKKLYFNRKFFEYTNRYK